MGPNTRHLLELIRRHRLHDHFPLCRHLLTLIERGLMEEDVAAAYLLVVQPMANEAERRPNLLERPPELSEIYPDGIVPPLIIGACGEDKTIPVGLVPRNAVHCIFGGTTGSGKTVGIRRLLRAVRRYNETHDKPIAVVCLDRKGDYADLPEILGPSCSCFDAHGELRIGLQNPPGMPADVWVNHIATLFAARAGLIAGAVTLADILRWLIAVMNPQPTEELLFPDFRLLRDIAERLPKTTFATKSMYLEALLQKLREAAMAVGELFQTFRGLDVEADLIGRGRSAVISMPNLEPPWLSHFLVELILSQVLMGRIHRAHRVDELEVLFVFDEADDDVSRGAEAAFPQGYMSPIARVLRQGREFGIGVVLGVGSLGPVSEHILNSATYHFLFRMGDAKCRIAAAQTLQLPGGADAIIPAMPPGVCLSRTPAWPHAILTDIEFVEPCRNAQPKYEANPHVPSIPLDSMPDAIRGIEVLAEEHGRRKQRQARLEARALRREARALVDHAAQNVSWPIARLYDLMGLPSPAVQKAIRKQLVDGGYAEIEDVRMGRKTLALIELKDAARNLLGKQPIRLRGRGKLVHKTIANWIAMVGRKRGYVAECEWLVPGTTHAVDAAWLVNGRWQAFEVVVTSEDNLESSLHATLMTPNSPVERVTIVAPQKATLEALKKQLALLSDFESYSHRVHFVPVEDFERELWPE